jgi:hypothetical protein
MVFFDGLRDTPCRLKSYSCLFQRFFTFISVHVINPLKSTARFALMLNQSPVQARVRKVNISLTQCLHMWSVTPLCFRERNQRMDFECHADTLQV